MPDAGRINRNRQRGAALVIVLWTSLLLSAIMAGALATARIQGRIAIARLERFKADEALRSALELAAWRIAIGEYEAGESGPILNDFSLNGYLVNVEFSIEGEKLDLNLASESILRGFFLAAGVDTARADKIAAQVADWRDPDDLRRPNGAEAPDYINDISRVIGNRPFVALNELKNIPAMTVDLYNCILPITTTMGSGAFPSDRAFASVGVSLNATEIEARELRLGTSSRYAAPGARAVIEAIASKQEGILAPQSLIAAYRITGEPERPFALVAYFKPAPAHTPNPACFEPRRRD